MLSEISQTVKGYFMVSLNCGRKNKKSWVHENSRMVVVGMGEMVKVGERVQTSNYKMNKLWGTNVQYGDYETIVYNTLLFSCNLPRELILSVLIHTHKEGNCEVMGVLSNLIVVIRS